MKKTIITLVFAICTMLAMTGAAMAFDFENIDANPIEVAQHLLENESCEIGYGLVDSKPASEFKLKVQEYLDALCSASETPTVACKIRNPKTTDSILILSLCRSDNCTDLSESVKIEAGSTPAEISAFICNSLTYDSNSEVHSLGHTSATATGGLSTGYAICQGYANLFAACADYYGIQVIKCRGYINGNYHVINMIRQDSDIYAIDCVLNDNSNGKIVSMSVQDYCSQTGFQPSIDYKAAFDAKYGA